MLINKSAIKEYTHGFNISKDFVEALSLSASRLIKAAVIRADANARRTVMAKDI